LITLTITVDDREFAGLLADAIARGSLAGVAAETAPASADPWDAGWGPSQETETPANPPAGTTTGQSPGTVRSAEPPSQTGSASSAAPAIPSCAHGPMKFVPGGFSKRTGKPYPAFWACQAPRGTATCKGQDA